MRRNVLTYKAPPHNEGYDLICIHPDPRHKPRRGKKTQIRIQVKSRFASDAPKGVPIKRKSEGSFDYLVVAFLNIGKFEGGKSGAVGKREPDFYTIPASLAWEHHRVIGKWEKIMLTDIPNLEKYKDEAGFELIAKALDIAEIRREEVLADDKSALTT